MERETNRRHLLVKRQCFAQFGIRSQACRMMFAQRRLETQGCQNIRKRGSNSIHLHYLRWTLVIGVVCTNLANQPAPCRGKHGDHENSPSYASLICSKKSSRPQNGTEWKFFGSQNHLIWPWYFQFCGTMNFSKAIEDQNSWLRSSGTWWHLHYSSSKQSSNNCLKRILKAHGMV